MATPKQTRAVLKRIYYHTRQLKNAIYDAQDLGVVVFDKSEWVSMSPNYALVEVEDKINKTTLETRAAAFSREIRESIK